MSLIYLHRKQKNNMTMNLIEDLKQKDLFDIYGGESMIVFIDGEWKCIEIGSDKGC